MTSPIILNSSPLSESQRSCVDLLSEALDEAKAGNIDSVGIVVCMKTGYATVMAGTRAGDLNMGCDSLKRKILDAVEGGNKRTGLVRAR